MMSLTPAISKNSLTSGQLSKFVPSLILVSAASLVYGALWLFAQPGKLPEIGQVIVLTVLLFLTLSYVISCAVEGRRRGLDRLMRYIVTSFFLLALLPLASLLYETAIRGLARFDMTLLRNSAYGLYKAEDIGIVHAIDGTLIVTGIATLISVPIGLLSAIYLVEYSQGGPIARAIRFFVDVMTGIPSIVAGLFAYTIAATFFGAGTYSAFSGALALSILMIPTVVRSSEEMLRIVPNALREASYAMGVPKYRTILRVVLPTALAGLITAVILAVARVIGETAPLLIATGTWAAVNFNPFSGQMQTLPVFVYYSQKEPDLVDVAWAAALTLILIVVILNAIGRIIAWKFSPKARG